jgi:Rhs element Vgr protein
MEENNTGFSSSVLSQEESDKIFGKYKSFDDYFKDPTHPYALVKVFIDGNELKASYTVEFTQRTNDHDTFKIITPDDSFDSFEGYLLEKSRYLFGKDVLIEFARFGKVTQTFEGIITNMNNPKHEGGGYGDLHILGAGKSILLESGKDCQSFEDKSLSQIIKEVCEDCPPEARVDASENGLNLPNRGKVFPYTVQYKESNYDFIKRLAKRNGEFFYYNGEKTIFGNKTQSHITLQEGVDLIEETFCASLLAQDFKYLSYNPETGTVIEKDSKNVQVEFKANHFGAMAVIASRNIYRKAPVMQFGNAKNEQELEDAVRLEREKRENLFFVKGKSRAPELKMGGCAELSDINGKAMETYRIIEIRHYHDGYEYYNEFTGIPNLFHAAPFIDTEAVPLGEIQTARVTDNNDPKGMGRVRVQFPWQMAKNQMTPWIRIVTPYAGAGKGQHFVPEIGEEVLVNYESGNAEKPFVMGAMYNGAETSGYHTAGNDLKVIKTRSGHTIIMNDSEDKMSITILDISGNTIYLDTVKKSITIQAPETIDIICKNLNIKVEENMKTDVGHNQENTIGKNIKTIAKEEISQDSGKKTIIASGDNTEISARKNLDLYGKKNLIGFTDGKTEFGAKEQMHVYGMTSLITAKDKIEYKAPSMNKLPENGEFKYGKEKKILNAKWMCGEMENDISNAFVGDKVSLLVQTRNYEEGESITLKVKEKNDGDVKEGEKEITLTGKVNAEGFAELKEEVEIEKSKEEEQKKEQQEVQKKLEEEKKATEIYKTYEGKDYTFNEWKKYEQKAYDEYRKQKERKSKGFWG